MNQSIKTLKDTGTWRICWLSFKLQKKNGILHKHGYCVPNNGPCPGSYKPPAWQTATARPTAQQCGSKEDVHKAQTDMSSNQSQLRPVNYDQDSVLKHPPWTPLTLWLPSAGGPDRNHLEQHTVLQDHSHKPSRNRETLMLAAAISSKVDAGNFRVAVRLLCSEKTVAPSTNNTYEALKTIHPVAPSDRRLAAEFKGNTRFTPLQVSLEDIIIIIIMTIYIALWHSLNQKLRRLTWY